MALRMIKVSSEELLGPRLPATGLYKVPTMSTGVRRAGAEELLGPRLAATGLHKVPTMSTEVKHAGGYVLQHIKDVVGFK